MVEERGLECDPCYQIGEVSHRTGVTKRTLRFYEERGLLNPAMRMSGGFRLYSAADIERVQRIKRLKSVLGLTLAEICAIIRVEDAHAELDRKGESEPLEARSKALATLADVMVTQKKTIAARLQAIEEMRATIVQKLERHSRHLAELERSQAMD